MIRAGLLLSAFLVLPAFQEIPGDPVPVDFSKVDRTLASEPKYVAEPRYAMILLGTPGQKRIWMAMDKAKPESGRYDVLYVDRDGDGNLGEEGERIVESKDGRGAPCFEVGRVRVLGSSVALDHVTVTQRSAPESPPVELFFRVNNRVNLIGGYGVGEKLLVFGDSPGKAPILHVDSQGPVSFLFRGPGVLRIGRSETVDILAGLWGSESATFMAFDENFLDLDKDKILMTLVAQDRNGKDVRAIGWIKKHC